MKVNVEFPIYSYHCFSAEECRLMRAMLEVGVPSYRVASQFAALTNREEAAAELLYNDYKYASKETTDNWEQDGHTAEKLDRHEIRELELTADEIIVAKLVYKHNEKVVFIKYLRQRYYLGLKQAKDAMDSVWDQMRANKELQMSA